MNISRKILDLNRTILGLERGTELYVIKILCIHSYLKQGHSFHSQQGFLFAISVFAIRLWEKIGLINKRVRGAAYHEGSLSKRLKVGNFKNFVLYKK